MDARFADWYRDVALGLDPQRLEARWQGVVGAVAEATDRRIAELTRLACLELSDTDTRDWFQGHFKAVDPTFLLSDNDHELAVLASAALRSLVERSDRAASQAALLIQIAGFRGWHPTQADLDGGAREAATRIGRELRTIKLLSLDSGLVVNAKAAAGAAAKKLAEPVDPSIALALDAFGVGLTHVDPQKLIGLLSDISRNQQVLMEEVNILWWLEGEVSATLDTPWRDVAAPARGVVAASEVAALTMITPGPESVPALLTRIMGDAAASATSVEDMVNVLPAAWKETFSASLPSGHQRLAPICGAITVSAEPGAGASWGPRAEAITNIDIRSEWSNADLAAETYRELLLLRSLDG